MADVISAAISQLESLNFKSTYLFVDVRSSFYKYFKCTKTVRRLVRLANKISLNLKK